MAKAKLKNGYKRIPQRVIDQINEEVEDSTNNSFNSRAQNNDYERVDYTTLADKLDNLRRGKTDE